MRILAISDVDRWEGYGPVLNAISPDVVVLAGDLVADPSASLRGSLSRTKHRTNFYSFLRLAGEKAKVLVVAGNHDEPPGYDRAIVSSTPGCEEISGKAVELGGIRFLGVGHSQARLRRDLDPLIQTHKGGVDLILSHCDGRRLKELGALMPRMIVQGHFGVGLYSVYGVPTVFTAQAKFAVIDITRTRKIGVRIERRQPHHAIRYFVRHPSLAPFGDQTRHNQKCYHCNPRGIELLLKSKGIS